MLSSPPSSRRRITASVLGLAVVAFSVPAVQAAFVADRPLVAEARADAERSRSAVSLRATAAAPVDETQLLVTEAIRLTNLQRVAAGLPTLSVHPAVASSAAAHSFDQAAMRRMSHTGSDGSDAGERLDRAGFVWRTWGENVARGQRSAADVVGAWMASPGHRANILNGAFTTIGLGVAVDADGSRYWTMVLAA